MAERSIETASDSPELYQTPTIEIDNYHGLTVRAVLVYLSLVFISITQLWTIVGSGAFARDIAAVVGGASETVWLSQVLVVTIIILGPFISQGADFWGRKWFLCGFTAMGAIGSIVTSRAHTMSQAVGGQVITGLSFGCQTLLYAVASEILPRRFRPGAQAGITAAGGVGATLALLGGSAIIKNYEDGFRIVLYISAGLLAASATVCTFLYNPPPRSLQLSMTTQEKLMRLDWVAFCLLGSGVTLFSIGLSWGQNPYSWTSARVMTPLVIGLVLLGCLVVHQTLIKKDGLVHHDLFKHDRNFALALGCIFFDGFIFFAANNYLPFEVGVLYETDPVQIGLNFAIAFFTAIGASAVCAIYSSYRKTVRGPVTVSFLSFTLFNILMATIKPGQVAHVWAYPVFLGIGLGFSLTLLVTAAQLSTPPALIATTTGLVISMRSLGGSVGLGIFTAIFNSAISEQLPVKVAAAVLPLGLGPESLLQFIQALSTQDQEALKKIPGVTPQIIGAGMAALKDAYPVSFRGIWITAAVFSFTTALCSLAFVNPKSDFTMHVDAPLEEGPVNGQRAER